MSTKTISLFDLAPGKLLLDRYVIRRANRQGGMSTTFEVEDQSGGGACEVQVFPAALFEGQKQAREFAAVIGDWKNVRSPAVLATRDVHALEDGTTLVVTDLAPGVALRAWHADNAPVEAAHVLRIGQQLLDGLAAIHAADLVHGDIKPHTIHVDPDKKLAAVLVDGGITPALWSVKHLGDKTALIGTPYYAPVEQFGGESPDVQSDVYNVATVLFELVTGVLPWKGKSFLEVFQAKLEKQVPTMKAVAPKVRVPTGLEEAIAGGLTADKKQRYSSVVEFRERLKAVKPGA